MNLSSCRRNYFSCFIAITIACCPGAKAIAEDPVFSGPQVGEQLAPFEVLSVYGETAGTNVDPIKLAAGQPSLIIFVHNLTRPGIALARSLAGYALSQKDHGVHADIVWLDDDKAKAEAYLTRAAGSLQFTVPVGVSVDGAEGPGAYGLNRNVELTILVVDDNSVKANFALVQPSVTEAAKIAAELAKLINQKAPEQKELEKFAYPGGGMMMQRNATKKPQPGGEDNKVRNNDLRSMMQELLDKDIEQDSADEAIKAIDDWVGDNEARKKQLGKMVDAVLQRGMGAPLAQTQLKKWQREYSEK